MPPLEAALKGAEQIGFTILSLTVSLIAVLIPLLFMGDVVGRLFREFAVTLGVTILISAVVSLTLTPMMCARLLRHTPPERAGPVLPLRPSALFDRIIAAYGTSAALGARPPDRDAASSRSPRCRSPSCSTSSCPRASSRCRTPASILGISEAPQTISFAAMAERQQALAAVILKDPAVESLSSFIGVDGTNTTLNSGRIQINLKPLDERERRARATSSAACSRSWRRSRASRSSCSRCRT